MRILTLRSKAAALLAALATATLGPIHAAESPPIRLLRFATGAGGAAQPSVAVDAREGSFVLTWQEREADQTSLWFAVIDRDGRERRRGRIAGGTNWFVNWADFPSLAVLDNGDWVTHYLEKSAVSTHAYDIRLLRSTDRGRSWSPVLTPHDDGTPSEHGFVSLCPAGGDRVLVVWLDGRHVAPRAARAAAAHAGHDGGGAMSLRSAVLDRSGALTEPRELDGRTCSCCQTDAVRIDGRTVVAYRDRSPDEIRDIATVVRSSDGEWSKPRIPNADGWRIEACPVNGPALAANAGRLLTAWTTLAPEGLEVRYTLREGDEPAATRVLGTGALGRVDAAPWRGGFLVSWLGGRGAQAGLHLTGIAANGALLDTRTVAKVPATRMSGNPRLASFGDRALLAWVEPGDEQRASALALALIGE